MGLSYDLISEFVKITNDKKDDKKEGTVYATVVSGTEGKYVRIDGSDLLTPMDTTTDIEDGERVTLMIKDHKAIVTGNVTTPSASTTKVDKVAESVNSVSDRVGTFELVVADKVSTNELEAYKATIEVLIANKATIEDLTATNAKIENLEVKNAEIENLVAEKATIEDLEVVNATIENLKVKDAEIENAVIENLKATTADIKVLNADFAQIKTLVNGNLTSDNILSFNLTSGKVTVDDAFIKDAMIATISAGKINAGKINTNSVSIGSEDGGMLITGSTQQFTDKNGNVRIQIGKDASGDFTFVLYGEDGTGQLINQNGITASAIGDGLIVNNMVSDHAAISGGKLDISSVITEINSDDSTTIKSSKIYLNEQAQSLEVAFNSLKTKVDTIQEVTIQGDLTAIVEQVQSNTSKIEANKDSISTLISQDTVIKKQVTDLQGTLNETETTLNSKYTSLSQNLNGFKTTVADTYATKKSVTDVVDNIESNYSTTSVMNSAIEQKAQEISASVSSTYATKNQVNTLDNNLKVNYSTTKQMESAINVAKEEINLGVSSIYETKENTTSKIQNEVNNIQVGGTNLWVLLDLKTGYESNGNINGSTAPHKTRQTLIPTNGSRQLVYQCWNPNKVVNSSNTNRVAFFDSSKSYISSTKVLALNGQTYQWQIINIPDNTAYIRLGAICGSVDVYDTTIKIKFEFGNKPTDYSLAPEDVINDISTAKTEAITSANDTLTTTISNYYTKSQTDSQINVAKESINLGVSTTYETKTNVQSKVTSTLNSAKSYTDTKKTEAISTAASDATTKANTAKQEAIKSANNTLSSTISNYYTKSQTDSQINVAKEAINLGVSTTYETKKNVQTKINNISIGSVNLLTGTSKPYSMYINRPTEYTYWDPYFTPDKQSFGQLGFKVGDQLTLGFNWKITKNGSNNFVYGDFRAEFVGDDGNYKGGIKNPVATFSASNTKGRAEATVTLNETILTAVGLRIRIDNSVLTLTISDVKMEKGNKATSWSPAPEDISNDISTAKSQAINTAASDATTKANNAKNDAIKSANSTLTSTISNYYTKSQTDSQIKVAKEAINLSVSNTYETKANVETKIKDISVGGTNLAFDTNKGITSWHWALQTNGGRTITEYWADGVNGVKMTKDANDASGWNYVAYNSFKRNKITPATTYVVSFEMKSNKTFYVGSVNLMQGDSTNTLLKSYTAVKNKVTANSTAWSKIIFRLVTLDTLPSSTSQVIYITGIPGTANATHYIRNLKLEVGNAPTAWSPAPEDVTSDINTAKNAAIKSANSTLTSTISNYYTKSQTDSQIKVAKEAINLSVSNTYETKTNVTSKVDSTLKSAKSYADTKKSEAISTAASDATTKANTAKNDAIKSASSDATSKVNAAKTELNTSINKKANSSDVYKKSEVYTKTQTDSQIKVAKEAINLSVSNTYETKTNVTTKINNINIGSVNRLTGTSGPYVMSINSKSNFVTWDPYFTPNKQKLKDLGFKVGDQLTIGLNWEISKNGSNNFVYGNFRTEFVGYNSDGAKEFKGVIQNPVATFSASNTKGRAEATVTLNETNLTAVGLRIRIDNSVLTLTISDVKMEKGNKATSWSPAPEDIDSDITSIESETKSLKSTVSSLQLGADSISASVKSLEESMVNTTNGLANDISKVQEQVNLAMTSSDVKLEIQKELSNGVKKVSTSTGFTFDDKGLSVSKTDSEMKTQITEDGMKIYKNNEVMLTANNQGVDAKNLHATTYLIIGNNSRMEDFTEDGNKRTAVFWIG